LLAEYLLVNMFSLHEGREVEEKISYASLL
jgi:hypothetical protein